MEDENYKNIKEYLRLKKLQEEDKSEEMIDKIFNEIYKEIDNDNFK